jgi:hypothetical protein
MLKGEVCAGVMVVGVEKWLENGRKKSESHNSELKVQERGEK